jgi:tetratricopeptide (TPR) repeat protein
MKNRAAQILLARISILALPLVAFGQQAAKDLFSLTPNAQNAVTLELRGEAKLRKGDLNGAIADFSQAIRVNPQYGLAYRNRGNAKRKKGDLDGAIADYNQAIKLGVATY